MLRERWALYLLRPFADEQAANQKGGVLAQGQLSQCPRYNAAIEGSEITLG